MARDHYEMSEKQCAKLLESCKPTPVMYLPGGVPIGPSQQENANAAWRSLGEEMGFKWDTVQPVPDKGQRYFTAERNPDAE